MTLPRFLRCFQLQFWVYPRPYIAPSRIAWWYFLILSSIPRLQSEENEKNYVDTSSFSVAGVPVVVLEEVSRINPSANFFLPSSERKASKGLLSIHQTELVGVEDGEEKEKAGRRKKERGGGVVWRGENPLRPSRECGFPTTTNPGSGCFRGIYIGITYENLEQVIKKSRLVEQHTIFIEYSL